LPAAASSLDAHAYIVFGVGNPRAEVMFVRRRAGEYEDRQASPFVSSAGNL